MGRIKLKLKKAYLIMLNLALKIGSWIDIIPIHQCCLTRPLLPIAVPSIGKAVQIWDSRVICRAVRARESIITAAHT